MRLSFEAKLVKRVCFLRIVMNSCLGPDSFVPRAKSHVRLTGPSSAEGSIVLNEFLGFGQSSSGICLSLSGSKYEAGSGFGFGFEKMFGRSDVSSSRWLHFPCFWLGRSPHLP